MVLSLLVLKLGPSAVPLVGEMVKNHLALFLSAVVLVFAGIALWAVLKRRKRAEVRLESAGESPDGSSGESLG
jgi:hypothetical protein